METKSIEVMCREKANPGMSISTMSFFNDIHAKPVFEKGQVLYFEIGGE